MMISVSACTAECRIVASNASYVQISWSLAKASRSQSGGGGCGAFVSEFLSIMAREASLPEEVKAVPVREVVTQADGQVAVAEVVVLRRMRCSGLW